MFYTSYVAAVPCHFPLEGKAKAAHRMTAFTFL